jgi:predicted acylesterase/phospholipase RssA
MPGVPRPASITWKSYVRYLWPLRVPVFVASAVSGLPWFALSGSVSSYLSGLFDPVTDSALVLITALALFNAWTVVIIAGLILEYGHARLDLPPTRAKMFPLHRTWWVASTVVVAGPVVWQTVAYAGRLTAGRRLPMIGFVLLGAMVAIALFYAALWIAGRFNASRPKEGPIRRSYVRLLQVVARSPFLAAGFLETKDGRPALAPGHGLAFGLACGSIFLYVATGFLSRNIQRPVLGSALAYILLLVLALTWIAGFAAFLFDRVRVPLMLLFGAWLVIVSNVLDPLFSTDHIYRTVRLRSDAPPLAETADLLEGTATPIVVATSGGGIQAAAWTARVVSALHEIDGFQQHLRLISAVSGGSVGAINLLASWPDCGPVTESPIPEPPERSDPNAASQESSLHAVGWGLVFKDLPRTVVPFFSSPYVDRGSVLEDAWKRESRLQRNYPDPAPFLASWRRNVAEHRCPAVVFNAMVAETGEPMLFSTTALPASLKAFSFYEHYPGRDVPITTAVRLSAAFPYVSPAARADEDDAARHYSHVVDGGYFDNYGVGTLAAMTDAALRSSRRPTAGVRHLLIIEICDDAHCSGEEPPSSPTIGGGRTSWPYQLLAPLSALVAMRSAAQRVTNRTTLRLLTDDWRTRSTCIETIHVPFGDRTVPMSWHMTALQKEAIDDAWKDAAKNVTAAVSAYLTGGVATPEGQACVGPRPSLPRP